MNIIRHLIYYLGYLICPLTVYLIWQYNNINKIIFSIGIIFCLGFIYARFIESKILVRKKYQLNFGINCKIKIAVFADLHFGVFNRDGILKKIVKKINASDIDLVMIPGDFAYYITDRQINKYFEVLKEINIPIYAVMGNHDHGLTGNDVARKITAKLKEYGVKVIDDQMREIEVKNNKISIVGLSDYEYGKTNYSLIEETHKKDLYIVLAHNPDAVYKFPNSRPDLVISGHTHGGQVRIPFVYKLVLPSNYNFDRGFYDINNMKIFVTPGVGVCAMPFRFLIPPELDIIEIN